jgi:hypothetical protein
MTGQPAECADDPSWETDPPEPHSTVPLAREPSRHVREMAILRRSIETRASPVDDVGGCWPTTTARGLAHK